MGMPLADLSPLNLSYMFILLTIIVVLILPFNYSTAYNSCTSFFCINSISNLHLIYELPRSKATVLI